MLGCEQAGFTTQSACELPERFRRPHEARSSAVSTIKANYPDLPIYEGLEAYDYPEHHYGVDLIEGGPPCQSWSTSGLAMGADDPRGKLLFDFQDLIIELQPKSFIIENVPALLSTRHSVSFNRLIAKFQTAGYLLTYGVYDAFNFGVAQSRSRLIIVGSKIRKPEKLQPVEGGGKTLRDAIGNMDDVKHHSVAIAPSVMRYLGKHPKRLNTWDKPAKTLICKPGCSKHSPCNHPDLERTLSVEESKVLFGIPESYKLMGSTRQQQRLLGNAVPVPLAYAAAISVKNSINN